MTLVCCPLSWVLNRCPSSVGVNAVQKPEVLDATSDLNDVVISAIKGTTQITKIIARIIWAKERLYMINPFNILIAFVRDEYANQEKSCGE